MARMRPELQILTAAEAVARISDGATVACSGLVGAGHPEALTAALEKRFMDDNSPHDLTLVYAAGQGDGGRRGLNHLAHPGLLKRVIGGHWNLTPRLGKLALAGDIEAYCFPQGVICQLFRDIAAHRPGVITKIGLNTFIDPANGGGRLNTKTTEPLVERVQLDGEEWLRFRSFPVDVALIRATFADRAGNLTMEREGLVGEVLPMAQAARNHGGLVIAQIEKISDHPAAPHAVRVPGMLIDALVIAGPGEHGQTFAELFNPSYVEAGRSVAPAPMPFSERKIIARRVLREIGRGSIVNLGIGMPEGVVPVAAEEGRLDEFTLTLESGPIGGMPAGGLSFGCSAHPEAIIDQPAQFDFYDGGGLDVAVLGAVTINSEGSVNISALGDRFAGVGGFVDISQNTSKVVFCCPFRAGGLDVGVDNGRLQIRTEGRHCKFVKSIPQVAFHGPSARERGQEVIYITERAVFRLGDEGLDLIEVASGIETDNDICAQMEFRPTIVKPHTMPADCFRKD